MTRSACDLRVQPSAEPLLEGPDDIVGCSLGRFAVADGVCLTMVKRS